MTPSVRPGRPQVLANCAVSVDGRLAYAGGRRALLSGPEDLARVQRLRARVGAIVVGVGTVIADDPSLRVHWELIDDPPGPEPIRVVLDSHGRTPARARVLDGSRPTIVATNDACAREFPPPVRVLRAGRERVDLARLFEALGREGVRSLLVEGGGTVLASLLREGLFDELSVYVAPVVIGGRSAPALALGEECPDAAFAVGLVRLASEPLGEGTLLRYRPARAPGPGRAPPGRHPLSPGEVRESSGDPA